MLSLSRRKPPAQRTGPLTSLTQLPDDVLIIVCSQCRIDELCVLRRTSAGLRKLIDEYITTIAPSVARSTFPLSEHLLARVTSAGPPYTLQWSRGLIPEHLASMLVDRHRIADEWLQSRYGIPAEDPFGDTLRDRVANGWRILRVLSNISRHEYGTNLRDTRISPADLAKKVFRPSVFKLESLKHIEDNILVKRKQYLGTLPPIAAQDYKIMFTLLSSAFSTSISNVGAEHKAWPFDFGDGIDGQRELRKGKSWLSWYVLAQGPDMFWQQWWSLPHDNPATRNYIRDRAIEAFANTPEKLADHQRLLAHNLQEYINACARLQSDFDQSNPVQYFVQYAELRLRRREAGLPAATEILGHVPFMINFRCPEEIVKRHEAVVEERHVSRISQPAPR